MYRLITPHKKSRTCFPQSKLFQNILRSARVYSTHHSNHRCDLELGLDLRGFQLSTKQRRFRVILYKYPMCLLPWLLLQQPKTAVSSTRVEAPPWLSYQRRRHGTRCYKRARLKKSIMGGHKRCVDEYLYDCATSTYIHRRILHGALLIFP